MRRTTPLTATAMLGLALLTPTTSASAAGETCRGEAATIVGTSDEITGTEGRDVIVTDRATEVRALGGDDLICVVPGRVSINVIWLYAGSGDDVVDTTGASSTYYIDTELGAGADTLEGGPGGDWVDTGDAGSSAEVDVVRTNAGGDTVVTAGGSDLVDLGVGDDRYTLDGPGLAADGRIAGGDGYDTFVMTVATPAEHTFDLAAGTYRTAGASADFPAFESLDLEARGARLTVRGTEGDDLVNVETAGSEPSVVVASTFAGDDSLWLDEASLAAGTGLDLGAGEDHLVAARSRGRLALDLEQDELRVKDATFPAAGVEDGFLMARRVTLTGDEQDNTLSSFACTTEITGGRGDDQLIWQGDHIFETYSFQCTKSATMRGGPGDDSFYGSNGDDQLFGDGGGDTIRGEAGDDRIRGGAGADTIQAGTSDDDVRGGGGADTLFGDDGRDVLVGGGGRDSANGADGRDRCDAERERKCER